MVSVESLSCFYSSRNYNGFTLFRKIPTATSLLLFQRRYSFHVFYSAFWKRLERNSTFDYRNCFRWIFTEGSTSSGPINGTNIRYMYLFLVIQLYAQRNVLIVPECQFWTKVRIYSTVSLYESNFNWTFWEILQ